MVCLVYLNENSVAHARYLIRRLRHRMPSISVLVAYLSLPSDQSAQINARKATNADFVTTTLVDTLDQITSAWRGFQNLAIGIEKTIDAARLPVANTLPTELIPRGA